MTGTAIVTGMESDVLVKILQENASEGYGVYEKGNIKGTKILFFSPLINDAPARRYLVFIIGRTIYANKIAGVVMAILDSKNISYKTKTINDVPGHMRCYIKRNVR